MGYIHFTNGIDLNLHNFEMYNIGAYVSFRCFWFIFSAKTWLSQPRFHATLLWRLMATSVITHYTFEYEKGNILSFLH